MLRRPVMTGSRRSDADGRVDVDSSVGETAARASGSAASWIRWAAWAVSIAAVVGVAWTVWSRRMIIDDGLIHLRVVQQIRSGNGPVFNIGQRVEVSSSPAWVWLLAVADLLLPLRLDYLAFAAGAAGTIAAGSAPLWGRTLSERLSARWVPVPAAVLILAVSPSFAGWASGALEGGLVYFWLALCWVGGIRMARSRTFEPGWGVLIGCGALVRQEFIVLSVAMLVVVGVITLGRRPLPLVLTIAGSLWPTVGYQLFRMAYYGKLVPNPSIAKDVGEIRLATGWEWFTITARSSGQWLTLAVVAVLSIWWLVRASRPERWVWMALTGGSTAALLVVVAAGGDFLGTRLIQQWLFALCLPVLFVAVPAGELVEEVTARGARGLRVAASGLTVVSLCSVMALVAPEDDPDGTVFAGSILGFSADVRAAERGWIGGNARPAPWPTPGLFAATGRRIDSVTPSHTTVYELAIGLRSVIQAPSTEMFDAVALADPVGSHLQPRFNDGLRIPGHEKLVPRPWVLARAGAVKDYDAAAKDLAGTAFSISAVSPTPLRLTERDTLRMRTLFLECEPLRDVMDAATAPLTVGRLWDNFSGSISRTRRRFDGDPARIRRDHCPDVSFEDRG